MRYFVTLAGREIALDLTRAANGGWTVHSPQVAGGTRAQEDAALEIDAVSTGSTMSVRVAGQVFDLLLDGTPAELAYALGRRDSAGSGFGPTRGTSAVNRERDRGGATRAGSPARAAPPRSAVLSAPMPGRIVRVLASPEQLVVRGTPLVVVEAMKMENELCATSAGQVLAVLVKAGDAVERGTVLVTFS